jgi:hypothetical protein
MNKKVRAVRKALKSSAAPSTKPAVVAVRASASESPQTISVPEAGRKYFDLSRASSYEAAARGEIPTLRVGRLLRVPIRAMERLMDLAGEKKRCA